MHMDDQSGLATSLRSLGADSRNMVAREDIYKQIGVDTEEADAGLQHIKNRIAATWPMQGVGRVVLPIGRFANIIELSPNVGIALCTDGVGSKTIIAEMMKKYDTIGIDCVAMNVNDLICVGAKPLSMVDYIAVQEVHSEILDAIGDGLCKGATEAEISISGGEIAQLGDIVKGFDLVGMAIGSVNLDKVLTGQNISEGDVVIGVKSNGIHSNGLTLARRALFEKNSYRIDQKIEDLGTTIGEELLRPTSIYVRESMEILQRIKGIKALVNITSDGLLNLTRTSAQVGFVIDDLIEPHPIFGLIQRNLEKVEDAEMFEVFNMGIGFCYVVSASDADETLTILKRHDREAKRIGSVVADPDERVFIPQRGLVGKGKVFFHDEEIASQFS